jgi:hypothetical protein
VPARSAACACNWLASPAVAVLPAGESARDREALIDALSDVVVPGVADDSFADRDDFDWSSAEADPAGCETCGCETSAGGATRRLLQTCALEDRDGQAPAVGVADASEDSVADRDGFDRSGAAACEAGCESTAWEATVAAAGTSGSALPAGTSCCPGASAGVVAFGILAPVDDCATSVAEAFDDEAGAATSGTGVLKPGAAGLAAWPI